MTRYHTKSGSIYEVEDRDGQTWVRRASGGAHYAGRCDDWKRCTDVLLSGGRLLIAWGGGRDEDTRVVTYAINSTYRGIPVATAANARAHCRANYGEILDEQSVPDRLFLRVRRVRT